MSGPAEVRTGRPPLPVGTAWSAVARSVVCSAALLWQRRVHLPRRHVGRLLRFADGTSARVYRETVLDRPPPADPCGLVVGHPQLRHEPREPGEQRGVEQALPPEQPVARAAHPAQPELHDERGAYRGVYEWDAPERAETYARALYRVLALVSVPGSIHYAVVPGLRRDAVLAAPRTAVPGNGPDWWRLVAA